MRVYASGLNPTAPARARAPRKHAEGFRAFKLKVGFGAERDLANLAALRSAGPGVDLMVDANQAWTLDEALDMAPRSSPLGWPGWKSRCAPIALGRMAAR